MENFIEWIAPSTQSTCKAYGLFPSVCIAQAILESGWGKYTIGEYNIFGRKWGGWGNYIEVQTEECYDGEWVTITDKFQDYEDLDQAIRDYCDLITQEPVYQECNNHLSSVEDFVNTLAPIYATDPDYGNKVLSTIRANNLTEYDI